MDLADDVVAIGVEVYKNSTLRPTAWADPATFIKVEIEVSYDGVWRRSGGCGCSGGQDSFQRDQLPAEADAMYYMVNLRPGTQRQLRGVVTASTNTITGVAVETMTALSDKDDVRERFRRDSDQPIARTQR
jgi:hypothetical protein